MQPFDHSRHDWHKSSPSVVRGANGMPRPALVLPLSVFTVHYGGAGVHWTDLGDTAAELWSIEQYAQNAGKPNEYNSCGDSAGETWEYAGRFLAAHSAGENATAWGHLTLYGLENLTEAEAQGLIAGIRKARHQCVDAGYLTADHQVIAHRDMPGAATACPGPLYTNPRWWGQIIAALDPTPDPGDDDMPMIAYIAKPPVGSPATDPWLVVIDAGVRYCTGDDAEIITDHRVQNAERYAWLRKSAGI